MPQPEDRKSFLFNRPGNYRIRVLGALDKSWSERLGGLRITACGQKEQKGPVTELSGKVRDQAELARLLNSLYELHLTLASVEMLNDE